MGAQVVQPSMCESLFSVAWCERAQGGATDQAGSSRSESDKLVLLKFFLL